MMDASDIDGNCLPPPPHFRIDGTVESGVRNSNDVAQGGQYCDDEKSEDGCDRPATGIGQGDHSDEDMVLSLNELMYSAHSFHVISLPVCVTMILAALSVTYINTPETIKQGEQIMASAYHTWAVDTEHDSTSKQLALNLANGLVIVTVIGTMTFGIVLLYKYRCMKCLIGYMMFSSMTLLGILGAELFNVAIEKYRIPIDWFSFIFGLYNFAVVGVTAIFYSKGIPPYITQIYLICSSVIIAWQLSHFDTISTWTLLIMLALYDLCAVLTPCGPLRALVNLMSDEDSPEMPGLLYEAEIPEGLRRPVMSGRRTNGDNCDRGDDGDESAPIPPASMSAERYQQPSFQGNGEGYATPGRSYSDVSASNSVTSSEESSGGGVEMSSSLHQDRTESSANKDEHETKNEETGKNGNENHADTKTEQNHGPTTMIPFAIAKLYRLPLTAPPSFVRSPRRRGVGRRRRPDQSVSVSTSPLLSADAAVDDDSSNSPVEDEDTPTQRGRYIIPSDEEYNPSQLRKIVEAILPANGAKIVKQPRRALQSDREDRYGIIGSDGTLKRVLFVDKRGKVFEEVDGDDDSQYEGRFSNTIKLGLGDFIFYSVLVAKSAQYSFACFVSSFLAILAGLGGTLVLLAVYKHALPALPISIFLACAFYIFTRFTIEPWILDVMRTPFYV